MHNVKCLFFFLNPFPAFFDNTLVEFNPCAGGVLRETDFAGPIFLCPAATNRDFLVSLYSTIHAFSLFSLLSGNYLK